VTVAYPGEVTIETPKFFRVECQNGPARSNGDRWIGEVFRIIPPLPPKNKTPGNVLAGLFLLGDIGCRMRHQRAYLIRYKPTWHCFSIFRSKRRHYVRGHGCSCWRVRGDVYSCFANDNINLSSYGGTIGYLEANALPSPNSLNWGACVSPAE
jgi:hypothetical protein